MKLIFTGTFQIWLNSDKKTYTRFCVYLEGNSRFTGSINRAKKKVQKKLGNISTDLTTLAFSLCHFPETLNYLIFFHKNNE